MTLAGNECQEVTPKVYFGHYNSLEIIDWHNAYNDLFIIEQLMQIRGIFIQCEVLSITVYVDIDIDIFV